MNIIQKIIIVSSYTIFCISGFSNNQIDSLENILATSPTDKRPEILNELAYLYAAVSPRTAIVYAEEVLAISSDSMEIAKAWFHIGQAKINTKDHETASKDILKALRIFKKHNDSEHIMKAYNLLGILARLKSEYKTALDFHMKTLSLCPDEEEYIQSRARIYSNMALVYERLGNYMMGIQYLKRAQKIQSERGLTYDEARTLLNIGNLYSAGEKYKEAETFYLKALELAQETRDKATLFNANNNLGVIELSLEDYIKAENYFKNAEAIAEDMGDIVSLSKVYSNMGDIYMRKEI